MNIIHQIFIRRCVHLSWACLLLLYLDFVNPECVNWCSQHGMCSGPEENAFCICEMGWSDDGCGTKLCPKGDDPLTSNQNSRQLTMSTGAASGELGGVLLFEFLGEEIELPAAADRLDSRVCSILISSLNNLHKVYCERGPINKNNGAEYTITLSEFPEQPWENNLYYHDGNPPLSMFNCNTTFVSGDVSNVFCEFKDVVSTNVKEYMECSNHGFCKQGTCECDDGFKGAACNDITDTGDHFLIRQEGPFFTGNVLKLSAKKSPSEDFNLLHVESGKTEILALTGDGDLTLHRGKLVAGAGAFSGGPMGTRITTKENTDTLRVQSTSMPFTQALVELAAAEAKDNFAALRYVAGNDELVFEMKGSGNTTLYQGSLEVQEGNLSILKGKLDANGGQSFAGGMEVADGMHLSQGDLTVEAGGIIMKKSGTVESPALLIATEGSADGIIIHVPEENEGISKVLSAEAGDRALFSVDSTGRTEISSGGMVIMGGGLELGSGGAKINAGGLSVEGGIDIKSGTLSISDQEGFSVEEGGVQISSSDNSRPPLTITAKDESFFGTVVKIKAPGNEVAEQYGFLEASAGEEVKFSVDSSGKVRSNGGLETAEGAPISSGGDLNVQSRAVLKKFEVMAGAKISVDPSKSSYIEIQPDGVHSNNLLEVSGANCLEGQVLLLSNKDADETSGDLSIPPDSTVLLVFDGETWVDLKVLEVNTQELSGLKTLQASGDLHIGEYAFGAKKLIASDQDPATVAFYDHGGLLSGSPDLSYKDNTLKVQRLAIEEVAGNIDFKGHSAKNLALVNCTMEGVEYLKARRFALEGTTEQSLLVIGEKGDLISAEGLLFNMPSKTLTVKRIELEEISSDVDFKGHGLKDAVIKDSSLESVVNIQLKGDLAIEGWRDGRLVTVGPGGTLKEEATLRFEDGILDVPSLKVNTVSASIDFQNNEVSNLHVKGGRIADLSELHTSLIFVENGMEGSISYFGGDGKVESDKLLKYDNLTLQVPKIGSFHVVGTVDFEGNTVQNITIASGTIDGIESINTLGLSIQNAPAGVIPVFSEEGRISTSEEIRFMDEVLMVGKVSGHDVKGTLNLDGNSLENAKIISPTIEGLSELKVEELSLGKVGKKGQILIVGEQGKIESSAEFVLNDKGELEIPFIGGHAVTGPVDFQQQPVSNIVISSGQIQNVEMIKAKSGQFSGAVHVEEDSYFGGSITVSGTVIGSGPYIDSSDLRFKTDVQDLKDCMEVILKLRPVEYKHRQQEFPDKNFDSGRQLGFIAQEVQELLPEVVFEDSEGFQSISYSRIVPVLVGAVQDLTEQHEVLKQDLNKALHQSADQDLHNQIENLQQSNKELRSIIEDMKAEMMELKLMMQHQKVSVHSS